MLLSPVGGNERRSIGDARADTVVFIWGGGEAEWQLSGKMSILHNPGKGSKLKACRHLYGL